MPNIVEKMTFNYSPNFDLRKRTKSKIKYLIFHYTGMRSDKSAIEKLTNNNSKVSCHYYIDQKGQIIQMVPDLYIAWHAGKSFWKRDKNLNKNQTQVTVTRYGNVLFSRGSILPLLINKIYKNEAITITDFNMTRFLMTLDSAIDLVLFALKFGKNGQKIKRKITKKFGTQSIS